MFIDGIGSCYGFFLNPECSSKFKLGSGRKLQPGSCIGISELGEDLGTQSRGLLMLPVGLVSGLHLLFGPFVSSLSTELDFRTVAMVGVSISSLAIFGASYANSYWFFLVTYGLLGGLGFSLVYLPAITIISDWFLQKRSLAVGVAFCGSGVGYFAACNFITAVVPHFSWKQTLIIIAIVYLHSLILVALFRSVETHQQILMLSKMRKHNRDVRRQIKSQREQEKRRQLAEAKAHKEMQKRQRNQEKLAAKQKRKNEAQQAKARDASIAASKSRSKNTGPVKGSIMDRIIEEKQRQRKTSVGSLDGMVITLANELISSDKPTADVKESIISAAAVSKITSAVLANIEKQKFLNIKSRVLSATSTQNNSFDAPSCSEVLAMRSNKAGIPTRENKIESISGKVPITEEGSLNYSIL
ncbi:hypothetical protein Ciccas_007346 [Cichlidogyrus casuarinus]|uniref:Uncharacterized protein n=1 Tax=Cichlidogyrus casuarinus TaxID=1844966 RepID=A0ABD2Q3S2_9PLAT